MIISLHSALRTATEIKISNYKERRSYLFKKRNPCPPTRVFARWLLAAAVSYCVFCCGL